MTERIEIAKLTNLELEEANKKYPLFASEHEAFSVILEEYEETKEELEALGETLKELWKKCKRNRVKADIYNTIKFYAENVAMEAIQVAAMAEKAIASMESRETRGEDDKNNICD